MARDYAGAWRKAAAELDRIAEMIEADKATDNDDHPEELEAVADELRASAAEYERMNQSK